MSCKLYYIFILTARKAVGKIHKCGCDDVVIINLIYLYVMHLFKLY